MTTSKAKQKQQRAAHRVEQQHDNAQRRSAGMHDKCAECGLTVADSFTGRSDLLCDYHASQ